MSKPYTFCPICASELGRNEADYQACPSESCGFIHYENPTPVVAAIVEYNKTDVILVQSKGWPGHWYGLVTGFLEKHEHPDEAVLREVKEELNLDAKLISLIGHYPFEMMNQLIIAYHVQASSGNIQICDELQDYKIIPIEKVRPWPSGTGEALKKWLETRNV